MKKEEFPTFLNEQPTVVFGRTTRELLVILVGLTGAYLVWTNLGSFLPGSDIGVLLIKGLFSTVPLVGSLIVAFVKFALMSESEQDGIIEGFKAFLNGLSFPIQILIRNLPHNLDNYLRSMEAIEGDLADMARDHAQFVRVLASRRALVKREYYVIV